MGTRRMPVGHARRRRSERGELEGVTQRGAGASLERPWAFNKACSRTRGMVEHVFGVIKHLWGYRKVRYRGLKKNAGQLYTLFALANLYRVRKSLLAS